MLDIGPIHCQEYQSDTDPTEPVVIAEAPGRIHYLGEHGEQRAGLFLSSAIDRHVRVAVNLRRDTSLRFYAADLNERKRTTLVNLKYKREDRWANYIKVAIQLFADLDYPIRGLNFTVGGDIPQQIGLASSSAIEIAAAVALREFFHADISDEDLLSELMVSQEFFFNRNISAVDYLIALSAQEGRFLVVDEKTLEVQWIDSPFSQYKILVMDSRVPRLGVDEELQERHKDIKQGLELLSQKKPGASFRDFVTSDLISSVGDLPEDIRRRSMHIIQELQRVYDAEEALKKADFQALAKVVLHSHESLRDLYEVSCPEVDWLVKRAQEIDGVLASRMTGSGFGGCTYTVIAEEAIEEYRKRLEDYERIFGFHPIIYEVKPAGSARLVSSVL